jgi:osomolarity two-component system, sensor histidine kinase SLN1
MVQLPATYSNGTPVHLGDSGGAGYPLQLYPNLTYTHESTAFQVAQYEGKSLNNSSAVLLGPIYLTNTAIMSLTVSINNNTSRSDILGWLTIIVDAQILYQVVESVVGRGRTGEVVIVAPGGIVSSPNLRGLHPGPKSTCRARQNQHSLRSLWPLCVTLPR